MRTRLIVLASAAALVAFAAPAGAQSHPSVPVYNSLPGATNTLYLDFAGFTYSGTWFGSTPGTTAPYHSDNTSTSSSFTSHDLENIQASFQRVAEKYAPFNINVTTVDPAVAAGQAASDSTRQAYYNTTARVMHTVIGGTGSWYGSAGGVSAINVFGSTTSGLHTNWVFSSVNSYGADNTQFIGEASSHEIGHALGLNHQTSNAATNDYREGTGGPNNDGTGPGSKAPTMGNSYYAERGIWSNGASYANRPGSGNGTGTQNDVKVLVGTASNGVSIRDDGVGHSRAAATALALSGTQILASANKGVIVPVDADASTFRDDYFKFTVGGLTKAVLNLGVPTGGVATLDGTLSVLDAQGNVVARAATASLGETLTLDLAGGDYFAVVSSAGQYGDMGSFTLSGSLTPVPEPAAVLLVGAAGLAAWRRRRARAGAGLAA